MSDRISTGKPRFTEGFTRSDGGGSKGEHFEPPRLNRRHRILHKGRLAHACAAANRHHLIMAGEQVLDRCSLFFGELPRI